MKKINRIYLLVFIGLISFSGCTTDDLDPTLEQEKSVEGSITDVSNLYGIIKGAYSIMTGSGYYGRDIIVTNEVRTDNCFSNGNSGRFTTEATFTCFLIEASTSAVPILCPDTFITSSVLPVIVI